MSNISFTPITDGSTGTASQVNTPLSTIYNDYNGNITDANISGSAAINQTKIALKLLSAQSAQVTTSETTTSTGYADLTTTTDTVTVTIGSSGLALLILNARLLNSGANASIVSFVASGANTIAATDAAAIINGGGQDHTESYHILLTGLTVGSTVFKMKYRVSGGTGTFINRRITVIPL